MDRRGPTRTPDAAKLRKGETRPSRLNGLEPLPRHRLPSMPKGLDPVARATWRLAVREMGSSGLITAADAHILRLYCEVWSR
jgi:phage terminase small subunit